MLVKPVATTVESLKESKAKTKAATLLEQTFNEIMYYHRSLYDRKRATSTGDRISLNDPPQHRYPKIRTTLILGKQQTMTQALPKPITFEQFLEWKPEAGRYELHDGTIIEMQPTGEHEEITGFLTTKLTVEFDRLNLPYFIPNQALVKPPAKESGYLPDVLILNRANLAAEPLWKKSSTVTQGASIPLVIEVVSTNWRNDYLLKVADYEGL